MLSVIVTLNPSELPNDNRPNRSDPSRWMGLKRIQDILYPAVLESKNKNIEKGHIRKVYFLLELDICNCLTRIPFFRSDASLQDAFWNRTKTGNFLCSQIPKNGPFFFILECVLLT
ncbi:hypothetical protein AVEN_178703-1 [Araneus ventricosus]|uniref:Uncharacterized protein n=1 Tax=Araneus ventricosus TaxID=182803 RepID=A0A4Y2Q922_ARAVE|nr:hypothetical protein AVEN_178703-1 [Araneus ventricosus]